MEIINVCNYCSFFERDIKVKELISYLLPIRSGFTTVAFNPKECHPRCVGKLDRWESIQKHNSYDIQSVPGGM